MAQGAPSVPNGRVATGQASHAEVLGQLGELTVPHAADHHGPKVTLVPITADYATRAAVGVLTAIGALALVLALYDPDATIVGQFAIGAAIFFAFMGALTLVALRQLWRRGAFGSSLAPLPERAQWESAADAARHVAAWAVPLDVAMVAGAIVIGRPIILGFGLGAGSAALIGVALTARWERKSGKRLYHRRKSRWRVDNSVSYARAVDDERAGSDKI